MGNLAKRAENRDKLKAFDRIVAILTCEGLDEHERIESICAAVCNLTGLYEQNFANEDTEPWIKEKA